MDFFNQKGKDLLGMTGLSWQGNLFIILMVVAATPLSAIIAALAWKNRNSPNTKSFFVLMLGITVWSFGYALELVAVSLASKNFCASIKYFWVILVPTAFLAFAFQYSGKRERLSSRLIAFLAIEPLITILGVWTNDYHGLFWTHIRLETFGNLRVRVTTHGIVFWVHLIYSYLFLLIGSILLLQMVIRSQSSFRKETFFHKKTYLILIGVLTPWVGNAIYVSGRNPFRPFDLTPFAFVLTGYLFGYSILRYRLLNIVPAAHQVLIESINDAVMVIDSSNHIVELNPAAKNLTGNLAPMVIGEPVFEILPVLQNLPQFQQETAAGHSEITLSHDNTHSYFDLGVWPLYSRLGRLRGRLVVLRDITEKKLAEEDLRQAHDDLERRVERRTAQLLEANEGLQNEILERRKAEELFRASEEKYRLLFENSFDVIYSIDRQFNVVSVSPSVERALGYNPAELVGRPIYELNLIPQKYMELAVSQITRVFRGEFIPPTEYEFFAKDGTVKIAQISGAPLFRKGEVVGLISIGRDITAQKKAEEELRRAHDELEMRVCQRTEELERANEAAQAASRAKSEFLASMSHELRTPLNHIIGFTELVVDKQFGDLNSTQEEYLNDVLQSSRHLLSLINDILDLSKVEAGKVELEVTEVNLRMLLEGSLTMVKEKALKHRIRLSGNIDGMPEAIQADERKLRQIMYNLLSNAVKFTPDGGVVTLSARHLSFQGGHWVTREGQPVELPLDRDDQLMRGKGLIDISVQDTGIGIRREDLERIFDPFEQVDSSASRRYEGTGLGLYLVKRLVELHGGKIWAESEGEGKGSKFIFLIPN